MENLIEAIPGNPIGIRDRESLKLSQIARRGGAEITRIRRAYREPLYHEGAIADRLPVEALTLACPTGPLAP